MLPIRFNRNSVGFSERVGHGYVALRWRSIWAAWLKGRVGGLVALPIVVHVYLVQVPKIVLLQRIAKRYNICVVGRHSCISRTWPLPIFVRVLPLNFTERVHRHHVTL